MVLSKEGKIGGLVAVSLVVFFLGFFFLKSSNLFSGVKTYYGYFSNVQGLQSSSLVLLHGVSVGKVSAIELADQGKVKVTMTVQNSVKIPQGSVAKLVSLDMLGGKGIRIELSDKTVYLHDNATFRPIRKTD
jgi:phospholipid/cholesterol/gamma-HCH transport system substrate-binding protein